MNNKQKKNTGADGSGLRHVLLATSAVALCLSIQTHAFAQSGGDEEEFDIPPSEMTDALQTWSEQADVEIIYAERDVADKVTNGVDGSYSKEAALDEIIEGTDLVYEINEDGVVVIQAAFLETDTRQASVGDLASREFRVAQVSQNDVATDANVSDGDDEEDKRDVIIVTGTNIRGVAPDSSPTRTFDRQDILNSGVSTAQDFIQTLPQNFGGGSNVDTVAGLPNDNNAGANIGFGASVNLRGLGSGSTLVLLNGHRLAPSSSLGDFVDISLIPASAIERVEVLTDGASSIYGADAVAGVVNFVLRDDFEGVEMSGRYGTVTEGDLDEYRTSITAGKNWNAGNALVSYEYLKQDNLSVSDRPFSSGAPVPQDLLPGQERHSVLASISHELTTDASVFGDFSFSSRDTTRDFVASGGAQMFRRVASTDSVNVSAGGSWNVAEDWYVDIVGTYSDVNQGFEAFGDVPLELEVDSTIWVADAKVSGTLFSLPGGDVKLAAGGHFRSEKFKNVDIFNNEVDGKADRDVYALFGEAFIPVIGPDNRVPGAERLEITVSGRFSDFSDFGSTANPKIGLLWSPIDDLRFRGSYSTSFKPPALGRVGASDRSGLAYPTAFINSVLGLTPGDPSIADVVGILLTGTADNLNAESSRAFTAGIDFNRHSGRHNIAFTSSYFDIKFENRLGRPPIPGNRVSFDVPNIAIISPEVFPDNTVVFNPSTVQINDALNSLAGPIGVFPGVDPLDAAFINFVGITRNLSLTFVRGFDFDIGYFYESNIGDFSLGIDGTFLKDFQQQGAVTTPVVEQLNTQFNPVDLKLRGRAGYSFDGFTVNVFVNYTDGYAIDNSASSAPISSWTTVDLSLSYDTGERFDSSILDKTSIRISVLNLFNKNPPATPSVPLFGIFGYDPTNASPLNRFIALELVKSF